jgi:hypothetical protein
MRKLEWVGMCIDALGALLATVFVAVIALVLIALCIASLAWIIALGIQWSGVR